MLTYEAFVGHVKQRAQYLQFVKAHQAGLSKWHQQYGKPGFFLELLDYYWAPPSVISAPSPDDTTTNGTQETPNFVRMLLGSWTKTAMPFSEARIGSKEKHKKQKRKEKKARKTAKKNSDRASGSSEPSLAVEAPETMADESNTPKQAEDQEHLRSNQHSQ